ncbi:hypothetical protein B0H21DRAFT_844483 [Amylocystis lapponica]|nr:hypothetical protein B0H21DRAFT_844483 [Amylocystis lapponica]
MSPAIIDTDSFNSFGVAPSAQGIQGPSFKFDDMYRMPSPSTPALDPACLGPSPQLRSVAPPNPTSGHRKKKPTGTRRNTREHVTPSATSHKEVSAVFAKKWSRSQVFGDKEDQLLDRDSLAPSDVDAIETKQRQNMFAARHSRKRKLEYQHELEQGPEHLACLQCDFPLYATLRI